MINTAKSLESMRDLGIDEETGLESVQTIQSMLAQPKSEFTLVNHRRVICRSIFADNGKGIPEEIQIVQMLNTPFNTY